MKRILLSGFVMSAIASTPVAFAAAQPAGQPNAVDPTGGEKATVFPPPQNGATANHVALPQVNGAAPMVGVPPITSPAQQVHQSVIDTKKQAILTPDDVEAFRKRAIDNQSRMANPAYDPDASPPEARRRDIDFVVQPGRAPDLLQFSKWAPTPITFLNKSGAAIPVRSLAWNKEVFSINGVGCSADNRSDSSLPGTSGENQQAPVVLYVVPCKPSEWGAVNVQLKGYPVPAVFIITASPKLDYIDTPVVVTVHMPTPPPRPRPRPRPLTPEERERQMEAANGSGPADLNSFMTQTPPQGAVSVPVSGGARAWRYNGSLYVRATGRMIGGTASGEATQGQQSVYRFDDPASVHQMQVVAPDGTEKALTIGRSGN